MANFQAHLTVGATVAGIAALAVNYHELANFNQAQGLFVLGVAGSLFPDIDVDDSKPVRGFFALLGLGLGLAAASALRQRFLIFELALIWVGIWLVVYFPLRMLFARLTVHRGIYHSLLMAATVAIFAVVAADRWLDFDPLLTWLVGGFVLLGYLTHLVLDEIASIDLAGKRIKRSFGTALKPLSLNAWPVSLLCLGLLGVGLWLAPDPAPLFHWLRNLGLPQLPQTLPAFFS
ncbi:metal-dependent hydrolase [Rhabdochromatium marinum]|uniref:metal-dependent hydrolase n=1 Tax=Rhabdochromatium marinum TaxID=48729 RepID=UPI0019031F4A|nr:metal-dependent hydrolase [Rhabdochromatium marinum]